VASVASVASVAGAAVIGVTGGLVAPPLAAGYLGALASSTVLVGGLFGAYGARMTGQMIDQYVREMEDFGFVHIRNFHRPRNIEKGFRRLRVAIGISG
jgi:hypothetical protein